MGRQGAIQRDHSRVVKDFNRNGNSGTDEVLVPAPANKSYENVLLGMDAIASGSTGSATISGFDGTIPTVTADQVGQRIYPGDPGRDGWFDEQGFRAGLGKALVLNTDPDQPMVGDWDLKITYRIERAISGMTTTERGT